MAAPGASWNPCLLFLRAHVTFQLQSGQIVVAHRSVHVDDGRFPPANQVQAVWSDFLGGNDQTKADKARVHFVSFKQTPGGHMSLCRLRNSEGFIFILKKNNSQSEIVNAIATYFYQFGVKSFHSACTFSNFPSRILMWRYQDESPWRPVEQIMVSSSVQERFLSTVVFLHRLN